MSHTRVGPWAANQKLTSSQQNQVDLNAAQSVDNTTAGDTVLGPLTFSGGSASITMAGTATNGITISSGSKLVCNGTMTIGGACSTSGTGSITIVGGTSFTTQTTSTVQILLTGSSYVSVPIGSAGKFIGNNGASDYTIATSTETIPSQISMTSLVAGGLWTVDTTTYPLVLVGSGNNAAGYQPILMPKLRNGATLASVTMYLIVSAHTNPPATLPQIDIRRTSLIAGSALSDVSLLGGPVSFSPAPATGTAWRASGNVQSWTATTTVNNTIDTTKYVYYILLNDEFGAGSASGNRYVGFTVSLSGITSLAF